MHAFLLVGQGITNFQLAVSNLATKLKAKIIEYPLVKIEDVRNLNNFLRLAVTEPTLIYCPNIQNAGVEALNAFLKNLEEPQENIYFALTAPSQRKVLPTIVSRCQVIQITNNPITKSTNDKTIDFLKMTIGEKFKVVEKIKERTDAINFVQNLIDTIHISLYENINDIKLISKNLETTLATLNNLKANGNLSLQLTNLVVNLV